MYDCICFINYLCTLVCSNLFSTYCGPVDVKGIHIERSLYPIHPTEIIIMHIRTISVYMHNCVDLQYV